MRLSQTQLPKAAFQKAVPIIESALQIFIDDVVEQREAGTVDLIYAYRPMPEFVTLSTFVLAPDTFVVGKTRNEEITASFESVPPIYLLQDKPGVAKVHLHVN